MKVETTWGKHMKAAKATAKLACVLGAMIVGLPALGQDGDTLKKIKATQTITIGHRDASSPFSYQVDKGQAVGYSIDLC
ncbi:MAG: hypothetical protein NTV97_29930, partial [Alphaproteobacteria bacterium]|nr:hypothetical protein [Alphaproteobacteria bacterium]